MSTETRSLERTNPISRRGFIGGMGVIAGAATLTPRAALAQAPPPGPATPSSPVTTPPRDFGRRPPPTTSVDPDVITVRPASNDIVAHPDGSYWFTDPPYGGQLYEGAPDAAGGPSNAAGRLKPRLGQPPEIGSMKRELPNSVYRADPSGKLDLVIGQDQIPNPNGLAFSPDYKKLYVISTGRGPGDAHAGGNRDMHVFDVAGNNKLSSQKLFADFMIDGIKCGPDGVRADVYGNLWVSSNGNLGGRGLGYSGVTVWTPEGKLIGRVRLPEVCGNLCFGGPKRT